MCFTGQCKGEVCCDINELHWCVWTKEGFLVLYAIVFMLPEPICEQLGGKKNRKEVADCCLFS